jgi:hypothetical protein
LNNAHGLQHSRKVREVFSLEQDVFVKHKCPQEWQIPLTDISSLQLLKSRANAKVTTSNHFLHYSSNIMKNDFNPPSATWGLGGPV